MIGLIGALEIEVAALCAAVEDKVVETVTGVTFTRGRLDGQDVVIARCGVGKVNAAICAEAMLLKYAPEAVVFTGIAGALGEGLNIGDLVLADRLVQHDFDTRPIDSMPGVIWGSETTYFPCDAQLVARLGKAIEAEGLTYRKGLIASGDQFIGTAAQREGILKNYPAAQAAEMEGAAVAHVCTVASTPCAVLRAMSDGANGDAGMDYPTFCRLAADRSIAVVRRMLQGM